MVFLNLHVGWECGPVDVAETDQALPELGCEVQVPANGDMRQGAGTGTTCLGFSCHLKPTVRFTLKLEEVTLASLTWLHVIPSFSPSKQLCSRSLEVGGGLELHKLPEGG